MQRNFALHNYRVPGIAIFQSRLLDVTAADSLEPLQQQDLQQYARCM